MTSVRRRQRFSLLAPHPYPSPKGEGIPAFAHEALFHFARHASRVISQ
jgi:hypothetical protein